MPLPSPRMSGHPLIVRLRNWVGDVTLSVPLLQRLTDHGYSLRLVGKAWAHDLLAGHGWPVHTLPKTLGQRVALLRSLRQGAQLVDPGLASRPLNALCLPYSFSSALDFRLAGLHALGHAYEGRSLLLSRALPKPDQVHELQVYWAIGDALLGRTQAPPASIGLRVSAAHKAEAASLRAAHGVQRDCIVVCPFAGGTFAKLDKTWPDFADFVALELPAFGHDVVVCPGPGEEQLARDAFGSATLLPNVNLGVYAALLQDAALMVANDTGPGHIAAAVGTPLVSVLGPSDPAQWGAWGPSVQVVQGADASWPSVQAVTAAVAQRLAGAWPGSSGTAHH